MVINWLVRSRGLTRRTLCSGHVQNSYGTTAILIAGTFEIIFESRKALRLKSWLGEIVEQLVYNSRYIGDSIIYPDRLGTGILCIARSWWNLTSRRLVDYLLLFLSPTGHSLAQFPRVLYNSVTPPITDRIGKTSVTRSQNLEYNFLYIISFLFDKVYLSLTYVRVYGSASLFLHTHTHI